MKKITELRDSWFEENGYWRVSLDSMSALGNYVNIETNLFTQLKHHFFGNTREGNKTIIYEDDKTITFRIVTPDKVLEYLNDKHK